jgi:predicted NBD/HSP70 family sugar kinase
LSFVEQQPIQKAADPSGGANQVRVRAYNERLVLSLVRRHGSLPKSEIAKRSGLTPQTVSVIMRSLEKDGLLLKGTPQKGKVGQPSVPMSLKPDGAYSIGLKIGRRSADLVLVDFLGRELGKLTSTYQYPLPQDILKFADAGIKQLCQHFSSKQRSRISGIGVSMPFELWNWAEKINAPQNEMDAWRNFDFKVELSSLFSYPIFIQNDATAACGAELVFGHGLELSDFVYFFIGTFVGGGIVLNHSVYSGRTGNAGVFGPMPAIDENGKITTLIDHASIFTLEKKLQSEGIDRSPLWHSAKAWDGLGIFLDDWIENTARHLARAIVASCAVIDFEAAIIDGAFPSQIRHRIVEAIKIELESLDTRGLNSPNVLEGIVGHNARVIGGACQPLLSKFLLNQNVLFKEMT